MENQPKPIFLVTDKVPDALLSEIENTGYTVEYREAILNDHLAGLIGNYTGIIVNTAMKLDAFMLSLASKLKYILRPGSGLDNIDLKYCYENDIKVFNSPEANADAVGCHTLGLLLGLSRHIVSAHQALTVGLWQRRISTGDDFRGKCIGLIGYGNTGSATARYMAGLGAEIAVYDKYKTITDTSVKQVELDYLYENAEVLSLHIPLNSETNHWIDLDFLKQFQRPIYLINTSRGYIMNTKQLPEALDTGLLKGVALDVLENEKIANYSLQETEWLARMLADPRVIITPHIAGWTHTARHEIFMTVWRKFLDWKAENN
ncbi:MAG: NAD(P)-dependent oxidoreductase [Bacteroidota bacterium]|nr:NAD(P)-dependent oxidoreductase [Bacteroidota bacterium]